MSLVDFGPRNTGEIDPYGQVKATKKSLSDHLSVGRVVDVYKNGVLYAQGATVKSVPLRGGKLDSTRPILLDVPTPPLQISIFNNPPGAPADEWVFI